VVGPCELSYLSVAGPLYRQLGVPVPVFLPRASLTLVEPSLVKLLDRFGWDLPDLEPGFETLAQNAIQEQADGDESGLETLIDHVKQEMAALTRTMRTADPQMVRAVERTRTKVHEEFTKLLNRLRNARQNREGTGLRQIRRICNTLRPRGRQQERVLTALPFMTTHGPDLGRYLVGAADPFTTNHGVLEL
jgi:uncharacterized protein YllA (UPF0747 family)